MTHITAKILRVICEETNVENPHAYSFDVYEFQNGTILVPSESTSDWFFQNRASIEACGTDNVTEVVETARTKMFSKKQLRAIIAGSQSEYGPSAIPASARELI